MFSLGCRGGSERINASSLILMRLGGQSDVADDDDDDDVDDYDYDALPNIYRDFCVGLYRVGGVWLGSVMKNAGNDCYRGLLAVMRLERIGSALVVEGGPSPPHMREKSDSLDSQD
jgi:hypothetical protein